MSVNLAPGPFGVGGQFVDLNGRPLNGGLVYTYAAGTTTPQPTFTTIVGGTPNANPITLSANGMMPQEMWLTAGIAYKILVTDSVGTVIYPYTMDNLSGINDFSSIPTGSEWIASGLTPTFVSASSFTVPGDQTVTGSGFFTAKRRLFVMETAGTIYGVVTSSSVTSSVTTVNVAMDGGVVIDSGISAVSYGLLDSINPSIPQYILGSGNTIVTYANGIPTITSGASSIQSIAASIGTNALTAGYAGGILDFRATSLTNGNSTTLTVPNLTLTVPSGGTLGTLNTVPSRLWLAVINNAGTPELAIINTQLGNGQIAAINESLLISTMAIAGSPNSAGVFYSTTARTNVAFRLVGYIESTQATAGTWASAASVLQGVSAGTKKPGDVIQIQDIYTSAVQSGSTAIPFDDTPPLVAEGTQFASLTITPTSAINSLQWHHLSSIGSASSASQVVCAFFRDADASARAASFNVGGPGGGNQPSQCVFDWLEQSGTAASTTGKIRIGNASGTTITYNGTSAGRLLGGVCASHLACTEIMA